MPPDVPQDGEVWEGGGHRYRMEKVVGNGAFGIVWRAREEGAANCVAIKKVVLDRRYHNRELEMMKGLDNEYVIRLHHSFEKPCAPPHRTLAPPHRCSLHVAASLASSPTKLTVQNVPWRPRAVGASATRRTCTW